MPTYEASGRGPEKNPQITQIKTDKQILRCAQDDKRKGRSG